MHPIPDKYCQFYIVRHGETEWNKERKIQGQHDTKLTPEALRQARELGKQLKNIDFSAVFSSDLIRAARTAQEIQLEKKATITTTQLLRERNMGVFEGKVVDQLTSELKKLLYQLDQATISEQKFLKCDVESVEDLLTRLLRFLRQTAIAHQNQRVLVVTHAGTMIQLLIKFNYQQVKKFRQVWIDNLGYFVLNSDGVDFEVVDTQGITIKPLDSVQ